MLDAFDKKYSVIALNGKVPWSDWKRYQATRVTEDLVARWAKQFCSYGIVMGIVSGGVVAIDFDEKVPAEEFFQRYRSHIRTISVTKRGVHFLFRGHYQTTKFDHGDIKGEGSYIVGPGSRVDGHTYWCPEGYELKPAEELCEFNPDWIGSAVKKPRTRRPVTKLEAYLGKVESIQGQNGSAGLVRAAAICRDAGLSPAEAMVKLLEWNRGTTVSPPWLPDELARAITRIYAKGNHEQSTTR